MTTPNPDNAEAFARFMAAQLDNLTDLHPAPAPADGDHPADDLDDLIAEIKADTERNPR